MEDLNPQRLPIGFVLYGALNRKDWRTISIEDADFYTDELIRKLIPTLRKNAAWIDAKSPDYGVHLVKECRKGLSKVLPFTDPEQAFLDLLLDRGVSDSTILTVDRSLQKRIQNHPLLEWKALNVQHHKGIH